MISQLSPALSRVSIEARPQDLFLQKESWVYFSPAWPDTWKWAKGKLFRVREEPIIVPYAVSKILPASDYCDIDLSNSTAGLKLYPEDEGVLYETALGFKSGNYIIHIYVPKDKYVYHLGESSMYPDVTDADKKYLGAKRPSDSPAGSPLLFLYFIKDAPSFYLRLYVLDAPDFEKVSIEFNINKLRLEEIPSPTEEQIKKAKRIEYYTNLVGY